MAAAGTVVVAERILLCDLSGAARAAAIARVCANAEADDNDSVLKVTRAFNYQITEAELLADLGVSGPLHHPTVTTKDLEGELQDRLAASPIAGSDEALNHPDKKSVVVQTAAASGVLSSGADTSTGRPSSPTQSTALVPTNENDETVEVEVLPHTPSPVRKRRHSTGIKWDNTTLLGDLTDAARARVCTRLRTFYERHCPLEVNKADVQVYYLVTEADLMSQLCERFGVTGAED